ncbi:hypothetical protein FACS1894132_04070 [Clostridia bacterium]|nr:hypothetical protein FACS1894132_04070 [Clostridia bacterium]
MAEKGKNLLIIIAVWLIAKELLNSVISIIGGGDLLRIFVNILVAVVFGIALLFAPSWGRYVIGVYLVTQVISFFLPNIRNFIGLGSLYLLEGLVDVIVAFVLYTNNNIKAYHKERE